MACVLKNQMGISFCLQTDKEDYWSNYVFLQHIQFAVLKDIFIRQTITPILSVFYI